MKNTRYRALVVDDEALIRQSTMRALAEEGFACDGASDGNEAVRQIDKAFYDLVVTDLRMPNKHGHALAVDLLSREHRPTLAVLTGVMDPRIAKDLFKRGVDDVIFKPVDYKMFAAKMACLVERRAGAAARETPGLVASQEEVITAEDIQAKLAYVSRVLPLSQAAIDVYNMANSNAFSAEQIAAAIQRDGSLSADVLRMANSSFYNPSRREIASLEQAVTRIGQNRVAALALTTNALATLTSAKLPWLNVELTWRRSLAAGVAVEFLIDQGRHHDISDGLLVVATMHPLGRVVLGAVYAKHYEAIIRACREKGGALLEREAAVFPQNHAQVMAQLLKAWSIPHEVCQPLGHVLDDYPSLRRLPEPLRTKVELAKVAILIGRLSGGPWERWDTVEFPPSETMERLNIHSIVPMIERARGDVAQLVEFLGARLRVRRVAVKQEETHEEAAHSQHESLAYCSLVDERFDFLRPLLTSHGLPITDCSADQASGNRDVLVNCHETPSHRLGDKESFDRPTRVVTNAGLADQFSELGAVLALPSSFGELWDYCQNEGASKAQQQREKTQEADRSTSERNRQSFR